MEFLANLHNKVIHFPIAFLIMYPFIELLAVITNREFFIKTAGLILLIGTLGSLAAALTGNQAFSFFKDWQKESLEIFNWHQTFANITVWYFSSLLVFRTYLTIKKKLNKKILLIILLLSLIGGYFVYQTANYGGKLSVQRILFYNSNQEIKN
jgi:uncharacterized membrane protein